MDPTLFDGMVKALRARSSRGGLLRIVGGGLVAAAGARLAGNAGAERRRPASPDDAGDSPRPDAEPDTAEKPVKWPMTQNEFVAYCRNNGGTSKSVGTRVVRCCFPAFCTTCDFGGASPACTDSLNPRTTEDQQPEQPGGGVYAPAD